MTDIKGDIKTAIDRYEVENGEYPHSLSDLVRNLGTTIHWNGPYLDEIPKDPWGHLYVYVFPGQHNPRGYDLYSLGGDGKDGTKDDIGNWTAK